ncbi:hypothetical protein BC829DRAFT_447877 [Chytridium lagenaria]|nr:hypothetical protein BC829DRAFT_447877 [Chytridium lagenaria]
MAHKKQTTAKKGDFLVVVFAVAVATLAVALVAVKVGTIVVPAFPEAAGLQANGARVGAGAGVDEKEIQVQVPIKRPANKSVLVPDRKESPSNTPTGSQTWIRSVEVRSLGGCTGARDPNVEGGGVDGLNATLFRDGHAATVGLDLRSGEGMRMDEGLIRGKSGRGLKNPVSGRDRVKEAGITVRAISALKVGLLAQEKATGSLTKPKQEFVHLGPNVLAMEVAADSADPVVFYNNDTRADGPEETTQPMDVCIQVEEQQVAQEDVRPVGLPVPVGEALDEGLQLAEEATMSAISITASVDSSMIEQARGPTSINPSYSTNTSLRNSFQHLRPTHLLDPLPSLATSHPEQQSQQLDTANSSTTSSSDWAVASLNEPDQVDDVRWAIGVGMQTELPPLNVVFQKSVPKAVFSEHEVADTSQEEWIPGFKRPTFEKPELHYVRYVEPTEGELARGLNMEWLKLVNEERRTIGEPAVPELVFELIMDRLEKEWFDMTKIYLNPCEMSHHQKIQHAQSAMMENARIKEHRDKVDMEAEIIAFRQAMDSKSKASVEPVSGDDEDDSTATGNGRKRSFKKIRRSNVRRIVDSEDDEPAISSSASRSARAHQSHYAPQIPVVPYAVAKKIAGTIKNLERVRMLAELVKKREKEKLKRYHIQVQYLDLSLS